MPERHFNYFSGAVIYDTRDPQRVITTLEERFDRLRLYPIPRGQAPFRSQDYEDLAGTLGGHDLLPYIRIARVTATSLDQAAEYFARIQTSTFLMGFFELDLDELLKAARASSGIRRFPEVAGISSSTVTSAENGSHIPRPMILRAYGEILNLDPSQLGRLRSAAEQRRKLGS